MSKKTDKELKAPDQFVSFWSQVGSVVAARKKAAYDEGFIGAAPISQAMLFNAHGTGAMEAGERFDALMDTGATSRASATR